MKKLLSTIILSAAACLALGLSNSAEASKPATGADMVKKAKSEVKNIDVKAAKATIDKNAKVVILDVREPAEWEAGHVPKAKHLPRGLLEFKIDGVIPDKNAEVLVYCKVGGRSALAAKTLKEMGYTNVTNVDGGFDAWSQAGLPVEK